MPERLNVCGNYDFNMLHHVGVASSQRGCAAAAAETHIGDYNTPSGSACRGVKTEIDTSSDYSSTQYLINVTRAGVSELQAPTSGCLSAKYKQIGLIICKHNCIGLPHGPES